jgi:hypothetical protein
MVGSAGATMVCSSALKNIASMMPATIARTVAGSTGAGTWRRSPGGASGARPETLSWALCWALSLLALMDSSADFQMGRDRDIA